MDSLLGEISSKGTKERTCPKGSWDRRSKLPGDHHRTEHPRVPLQSKSLRIIGLPTLRLEEHSYVTCPFHKEVAHRPPTYLTYTPQRVSMVKFVEAIQNKKFFRRPTLTKATAHANIFNYCAFYKDHDHDTEECCHFQSLMEELIMAEKLKEFVLAIILKKASPEKAV